MRFHPWNLNYWNVGAQKDDGDCVIRALCATVGFGYKKTCELLGVGDQFVMGAGYGYSSSHGITPDEVEKRMGEYVKRVYKNPEVYGGDGVLSPPDEDELLKNWAEPGGGMSIILDGAKERGLRFYKDRFVVFTISPAARNVRATNANRHATAIRKSSSGELLCVDGSRARGVLNQVPTDLFVVTKTCPVDSPDYYPTERKRILGEWENELKASLGKKKSQEKT